MLNLFRLYRRDASGKMTERTLDIKPDGTGTDAGFPIWVDDVSQYSRRDERSKIKTPQ